MNGSVGQAVDEGKGRRKGAEGEREREGGREREREGGRGTYYYMNGWSGRKKDG